MIPKEVPFNLSFHYQSVIRMLNSLDDGSRSDISYAMEQCAQFATAQKGSMERQYDDWVII